jgi:hypothetical protein
MMGKIVLGTYKIMMGKIIMGTYKIMMGKILEGDLGGDFCKIRNGHLQNLKWTPVVF